MPRILGANRNEVFDKSIYKEMGEMGFLGAPINGWMCRYKLCFLWINCQRNRKVDSSFRSAYSVQTLSMHAIYEFGSEEQKDFISSYGKG